MALDTTGWLRGIQRVFENIATTGHGMEDYSEDYGEDELLYCDTIEPQAWGLVTFTGRCYFYPSRDCPRHRPGGKCGRIGKEIPNMGRYVIAISKFDEEGKVSKRVMIECHTTYTLAEDIAEWVREEIDPDAQVMDITPDGGGKNGKEGPVSSDD